MKVCGESLVHFGVLEEKEEEEELFFLPSKWIFLEINCGLNGRVKFQEAGV